MFKACRELHRLDIHIGRALEKAGGLPMPKEITGANGRIIRFLCERESELICQKDIEKAFGITRSTASRVLTLMEQKGLIERHAVAGDARLKQVTLTDESRALSHIMCQRGRSLDEQLLQGFSDQEQAQLEDFVARMLVNMQA